MLKKWLIFSFSTFILFSCGSDPKVISKNNKTLDFVKTLGGSRNESGQSIINTNDGGYAILGFTQSINGDVLTTKTNIQFDIWILKFDNNDVLQWQRVYGGSNDEKAYQIINTNDNGFAIVGQSKSSDGNVKSNKGFEDVWVLKLNSKGDILWNTNTGFSGTDQGFSIIQTKDNGFFIGAILDVTASGGLGDARRSLKRHAGGDYWGIKINSLGVIEWRKYFGGTNTDTCYDVAQTLDGYLLIGSSDSSDVDIKNNQGSYDFWIVKINKSGTKLWEKSFGGSEIDKARAITKTNDGNFLIIGDTRSSNKNVSKNNGGADLWLIKIDTNGNLLWEKSFGGANFDAGRSIKKTIDGGFLISGSSRSSDKNIKNRGQNDAWIVKINNRGDQQWQQTYGGSNIDFCYDAIELSNQNIIAVGESSSNDGDINVNQGFSDLLIIKLK